MSIIGHKGMAVKRVNYLSAGLMLLAIGQTAPKPKSAVVQIRQADQIVGRCSPDQDVAACRETVRLAGVWDRPVKLGLTVASVQQTTNGLAIRGTVRGRSGKRYNFRTGTEREDIELLTAARDEAERVHKVKAADVRAKKRRDRRDADRHERKFDAKQWAAEPSGRYYKGNRQRIEEVHAARQAADAAGAERKQRMAAVKRAADARRADFETVAVQIHVKPEQAVTLNVEKLSRAKRLTAVVQVTSFQIRPPKGTALPAVVGSIDCTLVELKGKFGR